MLLRWGSLGGVEGVSCSQLENQSAQCLPSYVLTKMSLDGGYMNNLWNTDGLQRFPRWSRVILPQPQELTGAEIINFPPISQKRKWGRGVRDLLNPTAQSVGKTRTSASLADASRRSFHPIKFLREENASGLLRIGDTSLSTTTEHGVGVYGLWPTTFKSKQGPMSMDLTWKARRVNSWINATAHKSPDVWLNVSTC